MTKVVAGITSLDGYITGPDDGPGRGRRVHLRQRAGGGLLQSAFATHITYRVVR